MSKPLEIRPGQPLPKVEDVNWSNVSEIQLHVPSDYDSELRGFLTKVRSTYHVTLRAMSPEAREAMDQFVTAAV